MAGNPRIEVWLKLSVLLALHSIVCCASLAYLAPYHVFHLFYDDRLWWHAFFVIAAFSTVSLLFVFSDFSFGYFVGFYLYTLILGYLWLSNFSDLKYDRLLPEISAAASAVAFLVPALLISSPLRPFTMSERAFERLLTLILILAVATIASGAFYNFRIVGIRDVYNYRDGLQFPTLLKYAIGMTSTALLPFAFACFVEQKKYWRAGAALLLVLSFYPVILSKLALLTPVWLVGMLVLSKVLELRRAVIISLLAPMVVGLILFILFRNELLPYKVAIPYFGLINFRMIAIPSLAMDYYNEFFFRHDLTHFCQIGVLKRLVACPYHEPLSIVIYNAFGIGGNFNASLFATEGTASVGPTFAPVIAFACGLVIALANRISAGLAPRFILVSGALFPQTLMNIPFTTVLLSYGAVLLFLLWYVMPRPSSDGG